MQRLRKFYWQLYAFGLTPARLPLRFKPHLAPAILCTSIPKAGTNLAIRALCLHPDLYRRFTRTLDDPKASKLDSLAQFLEQMRPGQVVASHLRYSDSKATALDSTKVKHIFVVRDPRDVVISTVHYAMREKNHYLHQLFAALPDLQTRIQVAILGDEATSYQPIAQRLEDSSGWLSSNTHVLRFEDLVGRHGGGSAQLQAETLRKMFSFLGVSDDAGLVNDIAEKLFSKDTKTFRSGMIGQWREVFDPETQTLFNDHCGRQLSAYGYTE